MDRDLFEEYPSKERIRKYDEVLGREYNYSTKTDEELEEYEEEIG